jgi:uncharacterized small protein (DUF1192 family)
MNPYLQQILNDITERLTKLEQNIERIEAMLKERNHDNRN